MHAEQGPDPDADGQKAHEASPDSLRPSHPTAGRRDPMVSLAMAVAGAVVVGLVFYEINAKTSDIGGVRPTLAHSPSTLYR